MVLNGSVFIMICAHFLMFNNVLFIAIFLDTYIFVYMYQNKHNIYTILFKVMWEGSAKNNINLPHALP